MIVLYEVDHGAFQGVKPFTKVRGWVIAANGKRKEVVEYIGRWCDDETITKCKTRIKEQLACIK